jgi:hypothetical protein
MFHANSVAWLFAGLMAAPVLAQQGARPSEPASPPPSRWSADTARIDEALRAHLLIAGDARSNWVAGQLDRGDLASQVRHFAAARVADPGNKLYLATLAMACLEPVQSYLPECDAVDRLADWATRDAENGLPSLLLAERARKRRDAGAMLAHLANAAEQPRFDEYWGAGTLTLWETVRALPVETDAAAKLTFVATFDATRAVRWPTAARAVCLGAAATLDAVRVECARVGGRMLATAATWAARLLGGRIVARNAATPEARAAAEQVSTDLRRRIASCSHATGALAEQLESSDTAARGRAVADYERWLQRDAAVGEARACAEITAKKS